MSRPHLDCAHTLQGFLLVHLGPLPALRFNLAFQRFDYKEALGIPSSTHANILSGTGGLQISLLPGPVRPYITVSAFGEGRVQNIYTNDGGVINRKSITQVPVSFGILIGL